MAFTATAALVAAGSEATAAMVMAAAVEIGTSMVVVGMVTGNQTLTKVGGAISLVGGIGGMAAGAMSGTAASTAADASTSTLGGAGVGAAPDMAQAAAADASMGGPAATADMASGAADASGIVGNAAAAGPDITSAAAADPTAVADAGTADAGAASDTATMGGAPAPTDVNTPAGSTGSTLDAAGNPSQQVALNGDTPAAGGAVQTPASATSTPTGVQTPMGNTQPTTGTSLTGSGGSPNPNVNPTDVRLAAGTQVPPISSSSYFDKMLGFVQDPKNKMMLEGGAKLIGGALQGAQSQSQFNAKLDLENRRLAQTSYGSQVGQNRPHGIIQGARR